MRSCEGCGEQLIAEDFEWDPNAEYCIACADEVTYSDPEQEFLNYWHNPAFQITHTCERCGLMFSAHRDRGRLSVCEQCADIIEMGLE